MASFFMKFVFLLVVAPFVCSVSLPSGLFSKGGNFFTKKLNPSVVDNGNFFTKKQNPSVVDNGNFFTKKQNPFVAENAGKLVPQVVYSEVIKKFGIDLARSFFGADGEKGFRTGYKWGKRYIKIDNTCQKLAPCIPVVPSLMNYLPQCVLKCIVEIGQNINGNYCNTYRGCYSQNATCSLDQPNLLDANCGPNK